MEAHRQLVIKWQNILVVRSNFHFLFLMLVVTICTKILYAIKNCQILVKNLNFVPGMTRRFVSAKRLIRYLSNSSKLVGPFAIEDQTSNILTSRTGL